VAYRISSGGFIWGADGIALSNSTALMPRLSLRHGRWHAVFAWQADEVTIIQKVSPTGS